MRKFILVVAALAACGTAFAAVKTDVWHKAKGATTPNFAVDPSWPQPLPHRWILGQIGGLYVDHHDHIWVLNRPRSLTNDETGLEPPVKGALTAAKVPVNGLGFERPHGPAADCCLAAPSVLEFDAGGKLLQAWGGPSDAGWIEKHCKAADGCIWPGNEHGIYVDANDNIWIGGNTALGSVLFVDSDTIAYPFVIQTGCCRLRSGP